MATKSCSGGLAPASESLVALTKIMNRIVVSPTVSEPGVRWPESLALPSRRTAPAQIDMPDNFFENAALLRKGSKPEDFARSLVACACVRRSGGLSRQVALQQLGSFCKNASPRVTIVSCTCLFCPTYS